MDRTPSPTSQLIHLAWPVLIAQLAMMANAVIDTAMAGRLSAIDLASVGIAACDHGHGADVADQRVARAAADHRAALRRRAARRGRAGDTPERVDLAGAGADRDPGAVLPRRHHFDLALAAQRRDQGARLSRRIRLGRAGHLCVAHLLRPFHRHRAPAPGDVVQPAVAGAQDPAECGVHVRPAGGARDWAGRAARSPRRWMPG